ncbi:hypothetical protein [Desulfosediminicola flagellatus]|uniref:hypothetical protein n=1 Tax=Desulfosediminicola flagellatus TaxID=2569541 RepID=UPI0010ACD239|nr:hypothetical protein [Desulfosediminicola flagellatus]
MTMNIQVRPLNRRKRILPITSALLLLLQICLVCVLPAQAETVSGTIYDKNGLTPLVNQNISVVISTSDPCGFLSNTSKTDVSRSDGTFTVSVPSSGTYYIKTIDSRSVSDYMSQWWGASPGDTACTSAAPIILDTGENFTGADFRLVAKPTISGTFFETEGTTPITGSLIDLYVLNGDPCDSSWNNHSTAVKYDSNTGTYQIKFFQPGTYYLRTSLYDSTYLAEYWGSTSSGPDCSDATSLSLSGGENITGVDFQLDRLATLSGTLFQRDGGTPVTDSHIPLYIYSGDPCDEPMHLKNSGNNTSDGSYNFSHLPPGTYFVKTTSSEKYIVGWWDGVSSSQECSEAKPIVLTSGEELNNINFQLEIAPYISGTIFESDGSTPVSGADLSVTIYSESPCGGGEYITSTAVNSTDGTYRTDGIYPGTYFALVSGNSRSSYLKEYWSDAESSRECTDATPITITAEQDFTHADFQLEKTASISGKITNADGITAISKNSFSVYIFSGDPCGDNEVIAENYGVLEEDGTYTVNQLHPGTYFAGAQSHTSGLYVSEWWGEPVGDYDCNNAHPIVLDYGDNFSDVDFQVDIAPTISGRIFRADGITAVTEGRIDIVLYTGDPCVNPHRYTNVDSDQTDGTYTTQGLRPGTYYARASAYGLNYLPEWWGDKASSQDCNDAKPLTLSIGNGITDVDFQLNSGGVLKGTVFDKDGVTPVTNQDISIDIYTGDPCGRHNRLANAYVSYDGTFLLQGLPSGRYFAKAISSPLYLDEWWGRQTSEFECDSAASIDLREGTEITHIDFQLDPAPTILGTVYTADGITPITTTQTMIAVFDEDPCTHVESVHSAYVDPLTGTFSTYGLLPGTYYLKSYSSGDHASEWWAKNESSADCKNASPIEIKPYIGFTGADFQLDQGAAITGTAYEADGKTPILSSLISVKLYSGTSCDDLTYIEQKQISYSNGQYSFSNLPAGNYYLHTASREVDYTQEWWSENSSMPTCSGATPLNLNPGDYITEANFQLDSGGSISGTIFKNDGKTPVTDDHIVIDLYTGNPCGNTLLYTYATINHSNGEYTIQGVGPGTYYARISDHYSSYTPDWWGENGSDPDCHNASPIALSTRQDISGYDFILDKGAIITGTVFKDDGYTPFTETVNVTAYMGNPCGSYQRITNYYTSRNDGTFYLTGLPSETLFLRADALSRDYDFEWWSSQQSSPFCNDAASLTLNSEEFLTGVNFQLTKIRSIPGDINLDGQTDLKDLIFSLKMLTTQPDVRISKHGDVNNDGQIDLAEVLFILNELAVVR